MRWSYCVGTSLRLWIGLLSVVVVSAAALSRVDRPDFDFAQYLGSGDSQPKDEFRFVIVGDRTGGPQWGLMPQAFREINYLFPDFVMSVGDLIDGYGDKVQTITKLWDEFDKEVAILKSPFVYMPGNHDIWNATSRGIYKARFGPTYRSFDYRGLHFVTLDTEESDEQGKRLDHIQGKQLEWLKADIAQNRNARHILIFMHRPVWQDAGLDGVYELLEGLPVHIFAGHHHRYGYEEIHGIPHVILGAVAASMPEDGVEALGRFRSYAFVTVRDKDLNLALVRLGGVMSPQVVLEQDMPGIRQLANACAIYQEGEESPVQTRLVFRNPLSVPARLQVQKISFIPDAEATVSLFHPDEPQVLPDCLDRRARPQGLSRATPWGTPYIPAAT